MNVENGMIKKHAIETIQKNSDVANVYPDTTQTDKNAYPAKPPVTHAPQKPNAYPSVILI